MLAGLRKLAELNTVILKNNSVTDIGSTVRSCAALVKLSLAHNDVRGPQMLSVPSMLTVQGGCLQCGPHTCPCGATPTSNACHDASRPAALTVW